MFFEGKIRQRTCARDPVYFPDHDNSYFFSVEYAPGYRFVEIITIFILALCTLRNPELLIKFVALPSDIFIVSFLLSSMTFTIQLLFRRYPQNGDCIDVTHIWILWTLMSC